MTRVVPEKCWQRTVVEAARALGWAHYHTYDSRRSDPGFPDLVLVRDRVIFAELKSQTGRITPAQHGWIEALRSAGAEVYVWRPDDWEQAVTVLTRRVSR